jgi:AraC-like DNA-binding protein
MVTIEAISKARREEFQSVFGFAGDFRYPAVMRRSHLHGEFEINYLLEGLITYLIAGWLVTIPARRVVLLWAAVPHRIVANHGAQHFYWFTLPLSWVVEWGLPGKLLEFLMEGGLLIDPKPTKSDPEFFRRWYLDLASRSGPRLQIAQIEIEARIRRFSLARPLPRRGTQRPVHAQTPIAALHVQKMADMITRHHAEQLTVGDIVSPTGLHQNYGMTLFRATCGVSILKFLTRQRVFHAQRLLLTTNAKIIDIAEASGFGSPSRFYEAFAAICGCSPSDYRTRRLAAPET